MGRLRSWRPFRRRRRVERRGADAQQIPRTPQLNVDGRPVAIRIRLPLMVR